MYIIYIYIYWKIYFVIILSNVLIIELANTTEKLDLKNVLNLVGITIFFPYILYNFNVNIIYVMWEQSVITKEVFVFIICKDFVKITEK